MSKTSSCTYCGKPTTGTHYNKPCCTKSYNDIERENAYQILADIGVPFGSDGEPVGI